MGSEIFISELNNSIDFEPEENIFKSIWGEYERVILQSLITSFGLDFIVHDQYGGDVDTILNARKIAKGKDIKLHYKNQKNRDDYENNTQYDNRAYHSDSRYRNIVRAARKKFDETGTMIDDAYVSDNKVIPRNNKSIPRNKQGQLDHVIPAEAIHNDAGRILAEIDGKELANCPDNLKYTNAPLNRNKSNMSAKDYINKWCEENPEKVNYNGEKGNPLPEDVKNKLLSEYNRAEKAYEAKLARAYYTSPKFAKDTAAAAGKRGAQMGARQAMGFVFIEVWFAIKDEIKDLPSGTNLKDILEAVGTGIKKGFDNAGKKHKELIAKIEEGYSAGILASLTTTISNIFFTTAKNVVRYFRQICASVVQAGNVLLFNPDNLLLGNRIKTASVILATGASVLVGTAVAELIMLTPVGAIPVIGQAVSTFCASLVSGLLSCTLLIYLDRSKFMNQLIDELNNIPSEVNNYREIADAMERLAAKIANIDIDKFKQETEKYMAVANDISQCEDEEELNSILVKAYTSFGIKIAWKGDFDSFMGNDKNHLVFE